MKAVWLLFWQLCRLRIGPEDMPAERAFAVLIVAVSWGLSVFLVWLGRGDLGLGLGVASAMLAVDVFTLYALLRLTHKTNRFPQALAAFAGVDAVFTLIRLPLAAIAVHLPERSPVLVLGAVVEIGLFAWLLAIRGFIYYRTLNIGILQANLLAFALMMLSLLVSAKLFPGILPTPSQ